MTNSDDELEELVRMASSININIGTLDEAFIERAMLAAQLAKKYNKPMTLDPVGAGATKIRTKTAIDLMPYASIIKGNSSEIMALTSERAHTKGVESTNTTTDAKKIAIDLARAHKCTIIVSGPIDFITDGTKQMDVPYGNPLMTLVTGMGCAMAATVAAFQAVIHDAFEASCIGVHYFSMCGELAAQNVTSPGTFRMSFIDHLHQADREKMRALYAQ